MLKKLKVYVDTSVIGGCFDEEFAEWSRQLMENFSRKEFELYISNITDAEIVKAPTPVRKLYQEIIELGAGMIEETDESSALAEKYIEEEILNKKYDVDARHIALATVNRMDVLVSWNFKHIVHYDKILQFNAVNLREGYKHIDIYSPREVANE